MLSVLELIRNKHKYPFLRIRRPGNMGGVVHDLPITESVWKDLEAVGVPIDMKGF